MATTRKSASIGYVFFAAAFMASGSSASAEEEKSLTQLLSDGYEVKAAYQSPGQVTTVHYLILQKGPAVYQCGSYSSTMNYFKPYSNTYSCAQVGDLIPNQ